VPLRSDQIELRLLCKSAAWYNRPYAAAGPGECANIGFAHAAFRENAGFEPQQESRAVHLYLAGKVTRTATWRTITYPVEQSNIARVGRVGVVSGAELQTASVVEADGFAQHQAVFRLDQVYTVQYVSVKVFWISGIAGVIEVDRDSYERRRSIPSIMAASAAAYSIGITTTTKNPRLFDR
jgi:hypothetical protein